MKTQEIRIIYWYDGDGPFGLDVEGYKFDDEHFAITDDRHAAEPSPSNLPYLKELIADPRCSIEAWEKDGVMLAHFYGARTTGR